MPTHPSRIPYANESLPACFLGRITVKYVHINDCIIISTSYDVRPQYIVMERDGNMTLMKVSTHKKHTKNESPLNDGVLSATEHGIDIFYRFYTHC